MQRHSQAGYSRVTEEPGQSTEGPGQALGGGTQRDDVTQWGWWLLLLTLSGYMARVLHLFGFRFCELDFDCLMFKRFSSCFTKAKRCLTLAVWPVLMGAVGWHFF